jgi:Fe-S cluster biogenesis protein NfuA
MPPLPPPPYMDKLRGLVTGDGFDFDYQGIDPMSGVLKLRLYAAGETCAACVTTREWLEELTLSTARKFNPSIRRVVIQDDRP